MPLSDDVRATLLRLRRAVRARDCDEIWALHSSALRAAAIREADERRPDATGRELACRRVLDPRHQRHVALSSLEMYEDDAGITVTDRGLVVLWLVRERGSWRLAPDLHPEPRVEFFLRDTVTATPLDGEAVGSPPAPPAANR